MSKVPYVQRIRRSDGSLILYFRKGEHRRQLFSLDGTDALREEVEAILAQIAGIERAKKPKAGTVAGMVREYTRSAEFTSLAAPTQSESARYADEIEADAGDVLLREVSPAWVREMRDIWAARGHRAANNRLQVLKNALLPAIDDERITADPFARLKKVRPPHDRSEAHPVWEDREVEAFIALALERELPGLARAVGLARWGGFRRGTVCAIPLNARTVGYDESGLEHQRLYWVTEKRHVLCDKREDPRLTTLLAATPNKALTIAYNANGHAWKPRQLNQAIDRLLVALVKLGRVRGAVDDAGEIDCPLTIHGLRHSRGVELAHSGASDGEIMAQLEHATDQQAKLYRRQANRRRMADAGQTKVDNVIGLRSQSRGKPKRRS